ncbi:MAG: hypothetical protein ACE5FD_07105 [Anaerolineae bacterium]
MRNPDPAPPAFPQKTLRKLWQEMLAEPVTMAVFDRKLWETAVLLGLTPFPDELANTD